MDFSIGFLVASVAYITLVLAVSAIVAGLYLRRRP